MTGMRIGAVLALLSALASGAVPVAAQTDEGQRFERFLNAPLHVQRVYVAMTIEGIQGSLAMAGASWPPEIRAALAGCPVDEPFLRDHLLTEYGPKAGSYIGSTSTASLIFDLYVRACAQEKEQRRAKAAAPPVHPSPAPVARDGLAGSRAPSLGAGAGIAGAPRLSKETLRALEDLQVPDSPQAQASRPPATPGDARQPRATPDDMRGARPAPGTGSAVARCQELDDLVRDLVGATAEYHGNLWNAAMAQASLDPAARDRLSKTYKAFFKPPESEQVAKKRAEYVDTAGRVLAAIDRVAGCDGVKR